MSFYFTLFAPKARRASGQWMRRVTGDGGFRKVWGLFYNFALCIVDRFLLLSDGPDAFELTREGLEEAYGAIEDGQGFIVMSAHMGNPELGAAVLATEGRTRRVNVLRLVNTGDPYVDIAREMDPTHAPRVIALNDQSNVAALEAARCLAAGEVVAMKADRLVDSRTVDAEFFGESMPLPQGPFLLAALSGAPVIHLGCFREGPGKYRVVATLPRVYRFTSRANRTQDVQRWAAEYAALLQTWAKRWPDQWYNFHDVWKATPPR